MFEKLQLCTAFLLVVLVLVVIPVWFGHSIYRNISTYFDAKGWAVCDAKILRSEVLGTGKSAKPYIRYQFDYGGEVWVGTGIEISTSGRISISDFETVCGRFPVGARVPVFVDPKDPSRCFLYRGFSFGMMIELTLLVVFAPMLWFVLLYEPVQKWNEEQRRKKRRIQRKLDRYEHGQRAVGR